LLAGSRGQWVLFLVPLALVALFFMGILGFCVCTGGLALLSQPAAGTSTTGASPAAPADDPAGRPPVIGRPEVPKHPPPPPAGVTPRK
jgi:hypothetical protein